jgi:hypothetical protein
MKWDCFSSFCPFLKGTAALHFFNEYEIHHRIQNLHKEADHDRLVATTTQLKPVATRPMRQKVGIMLMRLGMRLAGYTL